MMQPDVGSLDLVVIGAGWAGERQARAVSEVPGCRLAGVIDPNPTRATAIAAQSGDESTWTATELSGIAQRQVSGAVICSPTSLHHAQTIGLLDRGIPCLVEKPLASNLGEVSDLITCAELTGTPLMSGQLVRSMPMFTWAAKAIGEGRIGEPVQVIERRLEDRREAHAWWRDVPDFLIAQWGSHTIDLVSYLFDTEATEVSCRASSARYPGVVDDFTAQIGFDTGLVMTTSMSLASRYQVHDLVIVGTEATMSFDCYRTARLNDQVVVEHSEDEMYQLGFATQLAAFAEAIRSGSVEVGDPQSVARSMRALDMTAEAARASGVRRLS